MIQNKYKNNKYAINKKGRINKPIMSKANYYK